MKGSVIWTPQQKQIQFMCRPEYEALYGGAAGGGKSDALLMEALRQVRKRKYRALLLRKTFPELEEIIVRSYDLYGRAYPGARYNENKHVWIFPSGARIYFGSMQHAKDRKKYQGQEYAFIGFDELTHFTWEEYSYMFSRNRSPDPSIRCYIRASTNPGGIGHGWVKERFISGKLPFQTYKTVMTINGIRYEKSRVFIPATVYDNPALLHGNPDYVASLAMLPEAELKALLGGSWDSFQGQVFGEFVNDPAHYTDRQWTHVIDPFILPREWRYFRSYDFGYSRPFSVGWWAMDHQGIIYRIKELYGCTGQPNVGVKWTVQKQAQEIRAIEDKYFKGLYIQGVADPSIWDESRGESIAQTFERAGVYWDRGDNTRIAGKMQLHYRLAFSEDGIPMMYVFKGCHAFIRTIPNLVYDLKDVEDIDTTQEDHCLTGDTLVWTEHGRKQISELVGTAGRVYSDDGKLHEYSDCRLTQLNVDVFEVELEDGTTIRATRNHRFMLADGTWKRLDELMPGDGIKVVQSAPAMVIAIRPAGTADVYNMEVADTHNFAVANGAIVHNCYDDVRYQLMTNPIAPRMAHKPAAKAYNPLETDTQPVQRYGFMKL